MSAASTPEPALRILCCVRTFLNLTQLRGKRQCSPPSRPTRAQTPLIISPPNTHPSAGDRQERSYPTKFLSLEDLQRAFEQLRLNRNTERTARREYERHDAGGGLEMCLAMKTRPSCRFPERGRCLCECVELGPSAVRCCHSEHDGGLSDGN